MFQEGDRVQIRYYLGYAATFLQADPRLESAITNIQSLSDGGTRPDSSSENQARLIVQKLITVDASIDGLDEFQGAERVDEGSFDVIREDARLRRKGRMYVYRLAKLLDTEPRGDVFGTIPAVGGPGNVGGSDLRAGAAFRPLAMNGRTAY